MSEPMRKFIGGVLVVLTVVTLHSAFEMEGFLKFLLLIISAFNGGSAAIGLLHKE